MIRIPGRQRQHITPLERKIEATPVAQLASISLKGLARAHRRRELLEMYSIFIQPIDDDAAPASSSQKAEQHPRALSLLREYADVFPDQLPHC